MSHKAGWSSPPTAATTVYQTRIMLRRVSGGAFFTKEKMDVLQRLQIGDGQQVQPTGQYSRCNHPAFGYANASLDVVHHLLNVDGVDYDIRRECSGSCNFNRRRVYNRGNV